MINDNGNNDNDNGHDTNDDKLIIIPIMNLMMKCFAKPMRSQR